MEPFCQISPKSKNEIAFVDAIKRNDIDQLRALLTSDETLVARIDTPWFAFDSPAVVHAKQHPDTVGLLVELGANINARSSWWAGSFGILDGIDAELARNYLQLGAELDIHAAVQLDWIDEVESFLRSDPSLIVATGGDGQHPLHFARSVNMIDLLVEAGAELEARDLDHSATAVQYLVDQPSLCRHLVSKGAAYDVFAAAALNETKWLENLFDSDPSVLEQRVGSSPTTKPVHPNSDQHIYCWRLKSAKTALEVAETFRNEEAYEWIFQRSSEVHQWLSCLRRADHDRLATILTAPKELYSKLSTEEKKSLSRAAWAGDLQAVHCFLDAGFDPHLPGDEQSTPLDRAAFHGYHQIVAVLLERDPSPPIHQKNRFGGTPLGACVHGAVHSWMKQASESDHLKTARHLLDAGASFDSSWLPTGDPAMDQLLKSRLS